MPRLFAALVVGFFVFSGCPALAGPVAYTRTTASGVPVNVVGVDLNDPNVHVTAGVAGGFPAGSESFRSFIARTHPDAAINGTFFGQSNLSLTGDLVVAGKLLAVGQVGTPVAVAGTNGVCFPTLGEGRDGGWAGFSSVVCAGPRLLSEGKIVVDGRAEGFRDRRVLGSARRSAVGLTPRNKLLLVTTRRAVTLTGLAKAMLALGATEAVNLDGGTSSALYCQGRYLTSPGRRLTNFILVYSSPQQFAAARMELAPRRFLEGQIAPASPAGDLAPVSISLRGARDEDDGTILVRLDSSDKRLGYAILCVNGVPRCITNTLPHLYRLDTNELGEGQHVISVTGYTPDGKPGPAEELTVRVGAPADPTTAGAGTSG